MVVLSIINVVILGGLLIVSMAQTPISLNRQRWEEMQIATEKLSQASGKSDNNSNVIPVIVLTTVFCAYYAYIAAYLNIDLIKYLSVAQILLIVYTCVIGCYFDNKKYRPVYLWINSIVDFIYYPVCIWFVILGMR